MKREQSLNKGLILDLEDIEIISSRFYVINL